MFPRATARSYARGLLGAAPPGLAKADLATDLGQWSRLLEEHRELGQTLRNSGIPVARRAAIARAVLAQAGAAELLQRFVGLVIENGHGHGFAAIATAVARAVAEASGVVVASVRTAHSASPEEIKKIGAALGQALGRKVEVEASVDPALIGGFVARAGDLVYDGSIARQIEKMRGELTRS